MRYGIIKGFLREELENSLQMKEDYERELAKLPKGSIVRQNIKGYKYYYLIYRENGKRKSIYKGKKLALSFLKKYEEAKELRAKYRKALSQIKRQIKFLQGALRGKEPI